MLEIPPHRVKILVADDQPQNLRLVMVRLRHEGYNILTATDGLQAIEKAKAENPDLILLDIMMPGKNGYDVCHELRNYEPTRYTPILMLTALDTREDKIKGLEAGADDFLTKPVDLLELVARVRSMLRLKHFQDHLVVLNRELELRNELMEQDLRMAREVQQQLLPHDDLHVPGFEVKFRYLPESQVGGDFIEITPMSEGRLGIFLADAMGHGAQAALVTVLLKTALNEILETSQIPHEILARLNERFVRLLSGEIVTYASACYVIVDRTRGELAYSNAGHPFPILLDRQRGTCLELKEAGTGTGLGLLPQAEYVTVRRPFDPSHALFLFTDGLYEVMDSRGDMFGVERLKRQLIEHRQRSLSRLIQTLIDEVDQFASLSVLPDDVTVVGIELASQEG